LKAVFEEVGDLQPSTDASLTGRNEADGDLGNSFQRPLRILFAVNAPWTERMGVPRVSVELTRQLERLGHQCSRYAWEEAFPKGLGKWSRFFEVSLFQWRLLDFLRRQGRNFDVVQLESNLAPFPRAAYGFNGIMVAKSNGLPLFYERWHRSMERRLMRQTGERGTWGGNCLRGLGRLAAGGRWGAALRTFSTADVIHVLNREEQVVLTDEHGFGGKVTVVPNGLSEDFSSALRSTSAPLARAASHVVAFVGTWALRKGQAEFPSLVRRVRETNPKVSFHLLGTCTGEEQVLSAFDPRDRTAVLVRPSYSPKQLPGLLAGAKVAVFPSYVEGFPLGALEMMAAGLPVVAWNAPGVRDLVAEVDPTLLVPAGNVEATATALMHFLGLPTEDYVSLSTATLEAAGTYTWQRSAASFLNSLKPFLPQQRGPKCKERIS
jgi:glycosyltransferase involved in cell wall biosynthesis